MADTSLTPLHRLRRAYALGKEAGVLLFIIGAALISPFAVYAGLATGNAAAGWVGGTVLSVLAPVVHVLGFLIGAGVIMAASGVVFGVFGWAVQAATRSVIGALRRRQPSHTASPGSGV